MMSVAVIPPTERHRAISTLMLAFAGDPITRWGWPDSYAYATFWPQVMEAFGGRAFESGTAHAVEGFTAVALWLPPGVSSDEATMSTLVYESVAGSARPDLDGFFEQMGSFHPTFPHWYLPLAGVDPPAQGHGLGSILLRHALENCDLDGLPSYLEATSPPSRDLYARHGFEVVGVIQQGESPPMWPMLREPR